MASRVMSLVAVALVALSALPLAAAPRDCNEPADASSTDPNEPAAGTSFLDMSLEELMEVEIACMDAPATARTATCATSWATKPPMEEPYTWTYATNR